MYINERLRTIHLTRYIRQKMNEVQYLSFSPNNALLTELASLGGEIVIDLFRGVTAENIALLQIAIVSQQRKYL